MSAVSEQELRAAANAPRVTLAQVMAAIEGESYTVLPDGRTTVCQLVMLGGRFGVTGQSACVDKANFNAEFGNRIARENAVDEIWPLLGFELAQKLSLIDKAGPITGGIAELGAQAYVGTKVIHAVPMFKGPYCELRGWVVPENEDPDELGYLVQYTDGGKPNVEGFTGYLSWSPRDVFEASYSVGGQPRPSTFLDRLKTEANELGVKLQKLRIFLRTPACENLAGREQKDLLEQASHMEDYLYILNRRIRRNEEVK